MNLPWMPQFIVSIVTIFVVLNVALLSCAYLIFLERKMAAWIQDRVGPNRTNFGFGFLPEKIHMMGAGQALADGLKLFVKEDYIPNHVNKLLFLLAPALVMITAIMAWAVIPWGGLIELPAMSWFESGKQIVHVAAANVNIGVIYILAISSLAVYGVAIGSYSSNNKYAFLGGVRAVAQMLSYEIPQGLCVLIMILMYQSSNTTEMSAAQIGSAGFLTGNTWGIIAQPFLAIIFFICLLAECNRAPFDLSEAEQELVGGFHTEYGSLKWAMFFLAEYMNMITGSAFFAVLFLGGWDVIPFFKVLPDIVSNNFLLGILLACAKFGVFFVKIALLIGVMMWVRWTLPRLRFDQLMRMAWRGMIPITIAMTLISAFMVFAKLTDWWMFTIMNVLVVVIASLLGQYLPKDESNNRIPLSGSRFSPAIESE